MKRPELADQMEPVPVRSPASAPKIGFWVWSPWYAKIWWTCIAIYWGGRGLCVYSERLDSFYMSWPAAYLNLIFMPMTPFLLLGIGFVWAWMDYHGLEFGPPSRETMYPETSVGGWSDPMSDPLDPRSPKYWHRLDDL